MEGASLNANRTELAKILNRVRKNTDEPSARCAKRLHKMDN